MDRKTGLSILQNVIDSGLVSKSVMARELGVHPSQVSRIAAGKFRRMEGHALKACKFALLLQSKEQAHAERPKLVTDLDSKVAQLIAISPHAAEALSNMLGALIDDLSASAR